MNTNISGLITIFIIEKIIIFILILGIIKKIKSKIKYLENLLFNSSSISLKVNKIGTNNILYYGNVGIEYPCPSSVYLNNKIQKDCYRIFLNEKERNINITLVWYNKLNSIYCLFCDCSNITEIKFLNFDTSSITNMDSLFQNCISLTSVDLSNLDIKNVKSMRYMFYNCRYIKSINLSKFNTSNVTDMFNMFGNCKNLTSIDLSNFDTSKLINMNNMFKNCEKLEYINLLNFTNKITPSISDMFSGITKIAVICIDKNKAPFIYYLADNMECITISCRADWMSFQNKIINKKCIINCSSTINRYKYNEKCYDTCPDNATLYHIAKNLYMNYYNCVESCIKEIKSGTCKLNFTSNGNYKEFEEIELGTVKENLINGFDTSDIDRGQNLMIEQKDSTITITNTENQKNEKSSNSIVLGECEKIIKNEYNISEKESLYILKIVVKQEG